MKAIDTNILVRYVVADDPVQARAAERIVSTGIMIPLTVLLEAGWVLQSRYAFERTRLADTVDCLFDVPTVHIENEVGARAAIAVYRSGADWAGAVHLAAAHGTEAFVTFDRKLARIGGPPVPVELVQADLAQP